MIATALVANSGSRSFIQVSKTVQANLVPLENDADGALAGTAQAKFGVPGNVLGQIRDAPAGLAGTGRVNLGWLLTGQRQHSGLDVGMVLTRWRTLGTIFESVQALLGEAVTPEPGGPLGETEVACNAGIGLTRGDVQDDPRAIGILLGRGAGGHATLQFSALGRQQPNSTATRFAHAKSVPYFHHNRKNSASIPGPNQSTRRGTRGSECMTSAIHLWRKTSAARARSMQTEALT
jgi:hypothetical protein